MSAHDPSFMDPFAEFEVPAYRLGLQRRFHFPNGLGASVIWDQFAYGADRGLYELAVIDHDNELRYDTPITDDVIGNLSAEAVTATLHAIAALEAVSS